MGNKKKEKLLFDTRLKYLIWKRKNKDFHRVLIDIKTGKHYVSF